MNSKSNSNTKVKIPNKPFLIVAIGASAGGLEAVTELLKHLPGDTGMAFVYIQHLDPTHESMLSSILSRATKMKVVEAENMIKIEPDHLYIIPPNQDMVIEDGMLSLTKRTNRPVIHLPVDKFFISLAERQKELAIGIILSGNASDGTVGLRAIKTAGGLTFAQDDSAKFKSMSASAINEGVVDMILSPQAMAKELERISKQANIIHTAIKNADEEIELAKNKEIETIIQMLKKSTGVDFEHYKINTIRRRIIRRMLLYKLETLKQYIQFLKQNSNEINILYQDLLINVTNFFRDEDMTEYLKKILLPEILKDRLASQPLRIWVPACSTGEEAYSLAITLIEVMSDKGLNIPMQIFATDLSELAIAKARVGIYSPSELADVSRVRLERFFTKTDGSYRIVKTLRDLCVFAPHNIFKDPPFSRIDLISCCNLMIYLDNVLQKKMLATFHYALNNNGYLILGKSETIAASTHLFLQVEKKYKIFAKKTGIADKALKEMISSPPRFEPRDTDITRKSDQKKLVTSSELDNTIDNILLTNFTPACVIVNTEMDILEFRGATSLFLEPSPGKASLNLMKMARPGSAFELRNAIHKANKSGQPIKKSGIVLKNKTNSINATIEVIPLKINVDEKLFMIIFEETKEPVSGSSKSTFTRDKLVKQLEDELTSAREDMRAITEEQEASMEELQSANEEVVSSNEELQSINEELETSKEELESANEELMTINSELQIRNEQLAESNEYAAAIYSIISEAVLILDENLRVKSANEAFYKMFKVTERETEDTMIYELGNRQWDVPELKNLLKEIASDDKEFKNFSVHHNFPAIGEKFMLLNAKKIIRNRQELVLLSIEDITEHKEAEKLTKEREAWFHTMADNAPVMMWVADTNKHRTFFNKTWLNFTGRTIEDELKNGWLENVHKDDLNRLLDVYNSSFDKRKPYETEYRLRRHDGEYRWVMSTAKPTSLEGNFTGYIGTVTDIHEKKMLTEELDKRVQERTSHIREMNTELERSNSELQQFAYVASHDLQEPLRKIMTFSDRLQNLKDGLPEHAKTYIERIGSSSERMSRLIDDLLNFSRISRDNKNFVSTDLSAIVKDVLADFDLIINQKKAKINYDGLPVIQAIPIQMEQLFHNLISNSLKFSKDDEPPEITISANEISRTEIKLPLKVEKSDGYIKITVTDNGIGFSDEFADQIFVIFQRLNDKKVFPGTGIGLALCRKIVNNHGGEIYAESKPNEGATFRIILPKKSLPGK
jgi:two-component system CheB/CheR fusion protein